jgi:hypothetical protein
VVHRLVLSAVLIVVTMVILDWLESARARMALARRRRRDFGLDLSLRGIGRGKSGIGPLEVIRRSCTVLPKLDAARLHAGSSRPHKG